MKKNLNSKKSITLDSPSKITINLYSLLAILLVIIPEYIAELILTIKNKSHKDNLVENKDIWEIVPELKISTMNIKNLREMARNLKINGYARENREKLSKRILKKLRKN